ncbi:unnamed protein product [Closterium sp. NIES-53]
MYLMTCTRPDLAYPLGLLARYVAPGRHRKVHMDAAKRVLRYLCITSGMGLVLGGRGEVVLTGHSDASWVDDQATQRSSQGYTFSLGSGSVSWRSTRSSSVLGSSCEAEIYATAMAAQELRWPTYLLTDLGERPRSPPVLYVDNKAAIALSTEPAARLCVSSVSSRLPSPLPHSLSSSSLALSCSALLALLITPHFGYGAFTHIALRYFLARELQQRGQLRLTYVATRANTADIFTKALPPGDQGFRLLDDGGSPINLTAPGIQSTSVPALDPAANAAVDPAASVAAEVAPESPFGGFCLGSEETCSPTPAGSRERDAKESSRIDVAVNNGGLVDDDNSSTSNSGSSDSSSSGGGGGGSSEAEVARRVSERMMALIAEGRDQLEGERLEEAVATYNEAERLLRRLHQRLLHGRGVAKSLLQLHEPAVADFEQAVSANPNDAELWMEVGAEREVLGQHERAFEAFSRALELQPGDAEALKRRGLSAFNCYRFKDALKDLLPVLHMLPNDADLNRAVVNSQVNCLRAGGIAGKTNPAVAPLHPRPLLPRLPTLLLPPILSTASPLQPCPRPHSPQGFSFVRSNQFRPAQPYLARAVELLPGDAEVRKEKGRLHRLLGETDEAQRDLLLSLELGQYVLCLLCSSLLFASLS